VLLTMIRGGVLSTTIAGGFTPAAASAASMRSSEIVRMPEATRSTSSGA
jgi:hypothetical protein